MSEQIHKSVPEPTLRRLPVYLRFVHEQIASGAETISCSALAERLGQDPTQIRKDLGAVGIMGRPRIGFNAREIVVAVEEFLGWRNTTEAFLIGAGHLGSALMGYEGFAKNGLEILAAFDADSAKVGTKINGRPVFHIDRLGDLVRRMHVRIVVITVPAAAAQAVADIAIEAGIEAIWNFAPASLQVPADIILENTTLSSSLAVLSSRLAQKTDARGTGISDQKAVSQDCQP